MKKIIVETYKGKVEYNNQDIQEMIDDIDMYMGADNLPKWLYVSGLNGVPGFPKNKKKVIEVLKEIKNSKNDVYINISSKEPYYKHIIKYKDGGSTSLGVVTIKFDNPKYNYTTNVSSSTTESEARKFFVGKMANVGSYPKENMQKVIDIDFSKSDDKMKTGGEVKGNLSLMQKQSKMARGGYLEGREEYEGYRFDVWYRAPKGYSVSGADDITKKIFKGDNEYFETKEDAVEHGEISIRSVIEDWEDDNKMAKGGGVGKKITTKVYVNNFNDTVDTFDYEFESDNLAKIKKEIKDLRKEVRSEDKEYDITGEFELNGENYSFYGSEIDKMKTGGEVGDKFEIGDYVFVPVADPNTKLIGKIAYWSDIDKMYYVELFGGGQYHKANDLEKATKKDYDDYMNKMRSRHNTGYAKGGRVEGFEYTIGGL